MKATRVLCVASLALLASSVTAQVTWTRPLFDDRSAAPLAYDSTRFRLVTFGGSYERGNTGERARYLFSETWERNGANWVQRFPTTVPGARVGHALAYDSGRARVVLFGGGAWIAGSETWEWDGDDWSRRSPATVPPARTGHTLVYDSLRGKTVLFGGENFGDTWEWDGSDWTQRQGMNSPPARGGHGSAFDPGRGVTVVFGGANIHGPLFDTWEWDGLNWTERVPATRPTSDGPLCHDEGRAVTVLFAEAKGETWEWDGVNWVLRSPTTSPGPRWGSRLAYDAGRRSVTMVGGHLLPETWEWDGTNWTLTSVTVSPAPHSGHCMTYDPIRQRTLVFGGGSDATWEWDGVTWTKRTPLNSPGARSGSAMTFDAARGKVVLFGGSGLRDTWEWDGVDWTQRTTLNSPDPRTGHTMAFDAARAKVVLFGGAGVQVYSDTWEWDGTNWTIRNPAQRPPAARGRCAAYDVRRSRLVLYGGFTETVVMTDTWEWDGTDWAVLTPPSNPGPRRYHAMVYDDARARVVLVGGSRYCQRLCDTVEETWEWDGVAWTRHPDSLKPGRNLFGAVAYDSRRARVVVFGGAAGFPDDTWELSSTHPAGYEPFGSGCAGSAGVPALSAVPGQRPWSGENFGLELVRLPPGNATVLLLGRSRTSWPPLTLPFDLGLAGMPGCTLYVSGQVIFPVANVGGVARTSLPIPADGALVGAVIYNQGLVVDPSANPLGAIVSNAGEGRIGRK